MRKAIIELKPNAVARKLGGNIFDSIERIEGRELLKLDFEKKTKLVIVDLFLKQGQKLDEIKWPKGVEILNVLKVEKNRHTVLLKAKILKSKIAGIFKLFDLNVIYDMPYTVTPERVILSAIGDNEPLNKLIKIMGFLGKVEKVSFTQATFSEHDLLNVLTDKQRDIIIEAKKNGYYNYPRKINTQELSEKLGISKATTVEHLRKAEMRLMSNLLEGY
jgi:predicted DNA binding protein